MATDLPELRQDIVQYLDLKTLRSFSLVCKAWYLDARPFLWSHFKCRVLQKCSVSPEEYALWLDTIRKNSVLFKNISYFGDRKPITPEVHDILLDRCHGLVSIATLISASNFPAPVLCWENTLVSLIETNRVTLQRLDLRWIDDLPEAFLPTLLASLPHLQSLQLSAKMILEDLLGILDRVPSSLERLSLTTPLRGRFGFGQGGSVNQPNYSPITSTAKPLRLKYFRMPYSRIQGSIEGILSRLAAHSLEEFWVDAAYCPQISPTVRDALWRLTSLNVQEFQLGDRRALPGILEAIHPHQLRRVYVRRLNTEGTAKLIERQHQSLESLSASFELGHTGVLADILATCGRLKRLTIYGMQFADIGTLIDPQKPWVCMELEVLEGRFGLSLPIEPQVPDPLASNRSGEITASRRIEEQFMRRLGQLTNLRCIVQNEYGAAVSCGSFTGVRMEKRGIEWSLASGLEHLHGLVHLRTFKCFDEGLPKRIGVPEMKFIKQHWRSLKEMVCNDIGDKDVQEWLATEWPELKASKKE